jgi:predicted enzyme related to lactoylglutathione lyase
MNEETRMVERAAYLDGEPCWVDVLAADMEAAKRFYGDVFGWTFESAGPEFGHYTRAVLNGRAVAGISPPPPGDDTPPAAWSLYLASHDLDGIARQVGESAGKVLLGPMDVPDNGRMVFALDPTGAGFGVFEPGRNTGCQLYDEPGALCWAELNTREPQSADAFYRELFDYDQLQLGDFDQFDYTTWSLGGQYVCGRLKMTANWTGIAPHWMVYFAVDDADAAADRARRSGGHVQHNPFDSTHGRIAVLSDPNGAVFSIMAD